MRSSMDARRALPRGVKHWPLKAALFLNFLVLAMLLNSVGAVALHLQRASGVAATAAGTLALCKSVGIASGSFGAVVFLTTLGYRRAMLISLCSLAVVCALVPSFPDLAMLRLLFLVAGAAFATIKISVYATIGLVAEDDRDHASLMSLLEAFFPIGIVLGAFLFGAFTDDANPTSHEWLRVFYFLAGLSAAAAFVLANVRIEEKARPITPRPGWRERLGAAFHLGGTRRVLWFGACVFLYVMIEQSTLNWLPTFNTQVLRLPARLSIQLASGLTFAVIAGRLLAGFALRRLHWFPILLGCLVTSAVLVLAGLFAIAAEPAASSGLRDAPAVAFLFPLIGFFFAPIYPTLNSAMLSRVSVSEQAAISSWGVMISAAGSSSGTLLVGHVFENYGGRFAVFSALAPIGGLMLGLYWFSRQMKSHPTIPA